MAATKRESGEAIQAESGTKRHPDGAGENSAVAGNRAAKISADTARYEALAREHGADLSEEGFNKALRKVVTRK